MIAFVLAVTGGTILCTSLIVILYIEARVYGLQPVVARLQRLLSKWNRV